MSWVTRTDCTATVRVTRVDYREELPELAKSRRNVAVFEGHAARTHGAANPLVYEDGNEYRDDGELARLAADIVGKPLTLEHPAGLIKDGAKAHIIGQVVGSRVVDGHAIVTVVVTDPSAIDAIDNGKFELSVGYTCFVNAANFQQNITVDHLAVVDRGRCQTCALRADQMAHSDCACGGHAPPVEQVGGYRTSAFQAQVHGMPCTCTNCAVHLLEVSDAATEMNEDAKLNAAKRKALPAHSFGIPNRQGLPLEDAGHVRDAMARFGQTDFASAAEKSAAYHRIVARAHELGIDASGFIKKHAAIADAASWGGPPAPDETGDAMKPDDDDMTEDAATIPMGLDDPDDPANCDAKEKKMDELKTKLAAAEAAFTAEKARADKAIADLAAANTAKTAAEVAATNATATLASETARADKAVSELEAAVTKAKLDADKTFDSRVLEKVELLTAANAVLGATDKDGKPVSRLDMSPRAIKVAIIKHVDGIDVADDKVEAFVDGVYAGALQRHAKAAGSRVDALTTLQTIREEVPAKLQTLELDDEDAAMAAMNSAIASAWTR